MPADTLRFGREEEEFLKNSLLSIRRIFTLLGKLSRFLHVQYVCQSSPKIRHLRSLLYQCICSRIDSRHREINSADAAGTSLLERSSAASKIRCLRRFFHSTGSGFVHSLSHLLFDRCSRGARRV